LKILLVDDEKPLRDLMVPFLKELGHEVQSAASLLEGLEKLEKFKPDTVLLDVYLPDGTGLDFLKRTGHLSAEISVVMITATVDVKVAVEAVKQGAEDYLAKPLNLEELETILKGIEEKRGLKREVAALKSFQKELYQKDYLFLSDPAMQKVYQQIDQVAGQSRVTVLILGETGTGKEHVAKLIHVLSPRNAGPFLELHCGAMPENLLESELFGYEPGAFTDARKSKPGLFEVAHGGTVFLDEVGEMPLTLQTKLLKVLEQKTLRRLGSTREIRIDVRIVAATNRDLKQEVQTGRFRADLFYRLNVATIFLPPLRSRPEDIRGLARFFFKELSALFNKPLKPLSRNWLDTLVAYAWPGNVRELKNVIERAVLYAQGAELTMKDLPPELIPSRGVPAPVPTFVLSQDEAEKENIRKVLAAYEGNKTQAAKQLGVSRTTLLSKIKKFNLE
jgi:two-component system response regulator AtoC